MNILILQGTHLARAVYHMPCCMEPQVHSSAQLHDSWSAARCGKCQPSELEAHMRC